MMISKNDRDFIQKIAKQLMDLTKRVDDIVKTIQKPQEGRRVPFKVVSEGDAAVLADEGKKPIFAIVTKFRLKGVDTMPEQVKVQEELRAHLTDFCRQAGIDELQIHFKETQ